MTTSYSVKNLTKDQSYKFKISAINEEGESPCLELDHAILARDPFGPPGPPTNVHVEHWDTDHLELVWDKPLNTPYEVFVNEAKITDYSVERKCLTTHSNWEEIQHSDANTFECYDTNEIKGNHEYQYQVFAFNRQGKSKPGGPTYPARTRPRKSKFCRLRPFLSRSHL